MCLFDCFACVIVVMMGSISCGVALAGLVLHCGDCLCSLVCYCCRDWLGLCGLILCSCL